MFLSACISHRRCHACHTSSFREDTLHITVGHEARPLRHRRRQIGPCRRVFGTMTTSVRAVPAFETLDAVRDVPRHDINVPAERSATVLEQRVGRVHRLGQRWPVSVVHFIAKGTIEEGMLGLLAFKTAMFTGVLDDGQDEHLAGLDEWRQACQAEMRELTEAIAANRRHGDAEVAALWRHVAKRAEARVAELRKMIEQIGEHTGEGSDSA